MAEDTETKDTEVVLEEDRRDTPDHWKRWIKKAKDGEAPEKHRKASGAAWREYEKEEGGGGKTSVLDGGVSGKPYPIYWASCKTLEPAYYSRTPKVLSKRKGGVKDDIALTMSLLVERLGEHFTDCTDFDDVMQSAVLDFIHTDKSCTQVTYTNEPKRRDEIIPLTLDETGENLIDPEGNIVEEGWRQEPDGSFVQVRQKVVMEPKVKFMPCPYDEVIHTPDAKCEAEIYEKAYYFYMPKDEAEKRFPDKEINWKSGSRDKKTTDSVEGNVPDPAGKYIEGWECWCKSTGKVYWVSEQCEGFLDWKEDPYKLRDFFPSTKFIVGSRPSKHLYPTPVFMQLLPLIEELHCASERIGVLISRIKRRALIDGANPELIVALNKLDDGEYVAVENLQQILEKGGVDSLVWFIPVKELVDAITELSSIQEKFKNEFFEWFGVPDILRGQTDPLETANAQEMKVGAAQDRFKFPKKLIARMARDSIEMMIDLALNVMSDEQIAEIANVEHWEEPHKARFQPALEALRKDDIRMIRVDIDTDSMSFLDDQMRAAKINAGVATLSRGLEQIAQMAEAQPEFANIALQALLLSLEAMGLGKEFEDMVKESVTMLIEKIKNPPEPPPPPPDYEMLKIQVQQAKVESQGMAKQRELDQADFRLQMQQADLASKQQNEAAKTQLEGYKAQLDEVVQTFMMQIEGQRVQMEAQRVQLDEYRAEIEAFKAEMQARESQMEEIRLASEAEASNYAQAVEAMKTNEPEEPASPESPSVTIINAPQTPTTPIVAL